MRQISGKILKKLGKKIKDAGLPLRGDLFISDSHVIDPIKCRILVAYNQQVGDPTMKQIEDFIEYTFNGRVHAQTASARLHKAESAISFICTLHSSTRPLTDSSTLRRIAGDTFSDDNTGNIWRVVDDGEQKYLMRQTTDNIADIVEARKVHRSRHEASFGNIKTAAPIPVVGDQVKFMSPDNVLLFGEVTKLSDDSAVVKANGQSIKIDRQAIVQITDRGKAEVTDQKNKLQDYWAKALGSQEFAEELTSKMSKETAGLGSTVPSSGDLEHS